MQAVTMSKDMLVSVPIVVMVDSMTDVGSLVNGIMQVQFTHRIL